jgi:hypothetical protein
MGIKIATRLDRNWAAIFIALVTFGAVGVLRLPMVPVVGAVVPASILIFYLMDRRHVR